MTEVCDDLLNPDVTASIMDHTKMIGYKNPYFTVEPGSEKGDNFIGIITKLKFKDREDDMKSLSLIVKIAPMDLCTRSTMSTHALFAREVWVYKKLMPIFRKLHRNCEGIELVLPQCISASDEDENEWLVLEDMSVKGFVLHRPRLAPLDKLHVKAALTALAHFHALSFVMKTRNPDLFSDLTKEVPDTVFPQNTLHTPFKLFVEQAANRTLSLITNKHHLTKVQNFCHNLYEKLVEVVIPNKHAVFCHGDFWKNNMLFKYKVELPIAVCPLDYQVLRVSSPATDVLYLLFCCTSQEDREVNYREYLQHYHRELCDQFFAYGLQPDIFPKAEFLSEVQRCGRFGLGMAMMVVVLMTCDSDNVPEIKDLVNDGIVPNDNVNSSLFIERMRGIVADCVSYGYI